jgi:hypothetical protein
MEEVATILRNSYKANAQKLKGSDLEDFEKKIVFNYAKNNNLWFDDILSFGTLTNVGGNEHTIVYNKDQGVLYKANNLYNSKFLISYYLEKIRLHSLLFQNTKYELVGFTGIDKGAEKVPSVEPIAKQNFIPNTQQASEKQIYNYMKSLGFRNVFGDSYRKKTIVVHDLKPRNVLVDTDGDVYVIDAEFINTEFKIY